MHASHQERREYMNNDVSVWWQVDNSTSPKPHFLGIPEPDRKAQASKTTIGALMIRIGFGVYYTIVTPRNSIGSHLGPYNTCPATFCSGGTLRHS